MSDRRRANLVWLRALAQAIHDGVRFVPALTSRHHPPIAEPQEHIEASLTLAVRQGDVVVTHTIPRISLDGLDAILSLDVVRDDPDNDSITTHIRAADRVMPYKGPEVVRLVLVGEVLPVDPDDPAATRALTITGMEHRG